MIPPAYSKYEKIVSVACCNFQTKWGDKAANLKKTEDMTKQAVSFGANIVVFPELNITGFECSEGCSMHRELAEPVPGPTTLHLSELTKSLGIYLVVGLPERDQKAADTLYISCVLLGPEGSVGVYRKLSFAAQSAGCFKPGNSLPVFDTRYGPVGLQTCSNLSLFPEYSRILALKGARLILGPTASPTGPGKHHFLVQQTSARATENALFVASANLVGKEINSSYYGHSTIAGPAPPYRAHIYAEAGEDEEIVNSVLSFESLHEYRNHFIFPYGLHLDLVSSELTKIASQWCEKEHIYPNQPLVDFNL